jgi:hypothetical protein
MNAGLKIQIKPLFYPANIRSKKNIFVDVFKIKSDITEIEKTKILEARIKKAQNENIYSHLTVLTGLDMDDFINNYLTIAILKDLENEHN